MRTRLPIAFDGRFLWNLARTAPELPCGRVTLPQMTRNLLVLPSRRGTGFFLQKENDDKGFVSMTVEIWRNRITHVLAL